MKNVEFLGIPNKLNSCLLNLTNNCNLACEYCIMQQPELKKSYGSNCGEMSQITAENAIDFIATNGHSNTVIVFYGGEPLLKWELLKHIIDYRNKKYSGKFLFSLITNAYILDDEKLSFLEKNNISILISLDGDKESNDKHRKAKDNKRSVFEQAASIISLINKKYPKIKYKVNATLCNDTLDIVNTYKKFISMGITIMRFEKGIITNSSGFEISNKRDVTILKRNYKKLVKQYYNDLKSGLLVSIDNFDNCLKLISSDKKRLSYCFMGKDYVDIAINGDIFPCHKLVGMNQFLIGNVNNDKFMHEVIKISELDSCKKCKYRFICSGYCRSENYLINKDFNKNVKLNCELQKIVIKLSIWLYKKLKKYNRKILFKKTNYLHDLGNTFIKIINIESIPIQNANSLSLEIIDFFKDFNLVDSYIKKNRFKYNVSKSDFKRDIYSFLQDLYLNGNIEVSL